MKDSLEIAGIKAEIITWVETVIEAPNTILGSYPICPFAKQARLKGQMEIRVNQSSSLQSFIKSTIARRSNSNKVQLIVERDLVSWPVDSVDRLVSQINSDMADDDVILLYDHPAEPGVIGDVCTSNGKYLIIFVQSASELNHAHSMMQATGYYSVWTEAYYKKIVETRKK